MDTHAVPGELTSLSRFAPVTTKHIPNQAMAKTTSTDRVLPSHELKGYLLGVVGVAIFSATLPMTKLAVGSDATPLMSGEFISFARAAIAALLSLGWLAIVRPPLPRGRDWAWLGITAFGVVLGFPLFSSMAMRYVDGTHASVVLGVLPLATAGVGALVQRRRAPLSFWLASMVGCALVVWFAARRSVPALGPAARARARVRTDNRLTGLQPRSWLRRWLVAHGRSHGCHGLHERRHAIRPTPRRDSHQLGVGHYPARDSLRDLANLADSANAHHCVGRTGLRRHLFHVDRFLRLVPCTRHWRCDACQPSTVAAAVLWYLGVHPPAG